MALLFSKKMLPLLFLLGGSPNLETLEARYTALISQNFSGHMNLSCKFTVTASQGRISPSPLFIFIFFPALKIGRPARSQLNMGKSSGYSHPCFTPFCFIALHRCVFYKSKASKTLHQQKDDACFLAMIYWGGSGTDPTVSPRSACGQALALLCVHISPFQPLNSKHKCSLLAKPLGIKPILGFETASFWRLLRSLGPIFPYSFISFSMPRRFKICTQWDAMFKSYS